MSQLFIHTFSIHSSIDRALDFKSSGCKFKSSCIFLIPINTSILNNHYISIFTKKHLYNKYF